MKSIPESKYTIWPLDMGVVLQMYGIKDTLELHDRVIVATAKQLNIPRISKDREITKIYKKTIWERIYLLSWIKFIIIKM